MAGKLIILIGPPAAGKSTWLRRFSGEVVSTDDIRLKEFGVQFDPQVEPDVWRLAYRRVAEALAAGKEVGFDATNTTRARRRPLIRLGKEAGAFIEAVVFPQELEVLMKRNKVRPPGKRVPDGVVITKYQELEMPTFDEGFDSIKIIKGDTGSDMKRKYENS